MCVFTIASIAQIASLFCTLLAANAEGFSLDSAPTYASSIFYPSTLGSVPDETAPIADTDVPRLPGWYFEKGPTDLVAKKINWYFFSSFVSGTPLHPGDLAWGDLLSSWAIVTFDEPVKVQAPYFNVYTQPKGPCAVVPAGVGCKFYDFRLTYLLPSDAPLTGKVFLFTGETDPGVHPEVEARLQLSLSLSTYGGITTPVPSQPDPTDLVLLDSLQTASNELGPVAFLVEAVGYASTGSFQGDLALKFTPVTASPTLKPSKSSASPTKSKSPTTGPGSKPKSAAAPAEVSEVESSSQASASSHLR